MDVIKTDKLVPTTMSSTPKQSGGEGASTGIDVFIEIRGYRGKGGRPSPDEIGWMLSKQLNYTTEYNVFDSPGKCAPNEIQDGWLQWRTWYR
jgi:hypothetical protein